MREPGIYDGIEASAYHAGMGTPTASLSSSLAKIILTQSPLHAWHACQQLNPDHEEKESAVFDLGTSVHSYILEGSEDSFVIIDAHDWRSKKAQDERDEARRGGFTPILMHQLVRVREMAAAVRKQLATFTDPPRPLTNGKPEQTVIWQEFDQDGKFPIWCRARVDFLHEDRLTIDDLKSTGMSASPENFIRASLYGMGMAEQSAFYTRGVKAITGVEPKFRYIVAESDAPFAMSVVSLGPQAAALASDNVEQAIQAWRRCIYSGLWPGYPNRVCFADAPAWALAEAEVRRLDDEKDGVAQ